MRHAAAARCVRAWRATAGRRVTTARRAAAVLCRAQARLFFVWRAVSARALALPKPTGAVAGAAGETWYFQCWYRDHGAGGGAATSNFSDGVAVTLE